MTSNATEISSLEVQNMRDVKSTEDGNEEEEEIQEELQCEEVDLNDPHLDPLEWTVRKTISIPKKYYWETENYDVSMRTKVWHRTIQSMGIALRGAEKMGEICANILGLNSSRYHYVTDFMTDEEWAQAKQNLEEAKVKRREFLKQQEQQKSKINVV